MFHLGIFYPLSLLLCGRYIWKLFKLTETHGFFLYLYLVSDLFLVYVIVHVAVGRRKGSTKIVENHKVPKGHALFFTCGEAK